jgi:rhamnogalacturonyl hydrolase YesR
MTESFTSTVEYAESFLSYFSRFICEDELFIPELATATRVITLMRSTEMTDSDRFAQITSEMQAIENIPHHDGSGWHQFKNAVRCWLEGHGYQP